MEEVTSALGVMTGVLEEVVVAAAWVVVVVGVLTGATEVAEEVVTELSTVQW